MCANLFCWWNILCFEKKLAKSRFTTLESTCVFIFLFFQKSRNLSHLITCIQIDSKKSWKHQKTRKSCFSFFLQILSFFFLVFSWFWKSTMKSNTEKVSQLIRAQIELQNRILETLKNSRNKIVRCERTRFVQIARVFLSQYESKRGHKSLLYHWGIHFFGVHWATLMQ